MAPVTHVSSDESRSENPKLLCAADASCGAKAEPPARYVQLGTGATREHSGNRRHIHGIGAVLVLIGVAISVIYLRPTNEYDCDGDGIDDCGEYNYEVGFCYNKARCGKFPKFGDVTLGQSCRCRQCADPSFQGTAFGDAILKRPDSDAPFDALPWGSFKNWGDHIESCAPWLMPRDEKSIRVLLEYAKKQGYKVRVAGSAHSAGGLITDGEDNQVFVISLGEFTSSDPEWEFGLRNMSDGSARATINAGYTLLQLFSKTRPYGFFLPTQTAGYYFSLGGIVANSVHGGGYNAGFVYSYVSRMRVMGHDGEIRIIDSENDLRYWRASLGLLGVILGIEFELKQREELEMYTVSRNLEEWSAEELWSFIKHDAEADVPDDVVPEGGINGSRASWNAQYFVDFVNGDDKPRILAYAQKTNETIDDDFSGPLELPENALERYQDMLENLVTLEGHGTMTYEQAARRDGSPPLSIAGLDLNKVLSALNWLPLARAMSWSAIVGIPMFVRDFREKINDGFFQAQTPAALAAAFYFEPADAFKALDFLRKVQIESLNSTEFVWNLPAEFRFINITDAAVLQPVSPGLRVAVEMMSFEDLAQNDQSWKRDFKRVEDFWVDSMGSTPHLGKIWGFAETPDGRTEPFQTSRSCNIFSAQQKADFESYRNAADPDDLFFSGLAKDLLMPCVTPSIS